MTDNAGRFEFKVGPEAANKKVILTVARNEQASAARSKRGYTLTGADQDLGTTPLWEPQLQFSSRGASWSPAPPNGGKGTLDLRGRGRRPHVAGGKRHERHL